MTMTMIRRCSLLQALIALFLLSPLIVTSQVITGKIVTCRGCKLNQYEEVRDFILDGEAEEYRGVTVEFEQGKPAMLFVYHDGEMVRRVGLLNFQSKDALHNLFRGVGFEKMTNVEIYELWRQREFDEEQEAMHQAAVKADEKERKVEKLLAAGGGDGEL